METNQSTYRIRTKLGETEPINIPISLMQEYNSFELLSLKLNMDDTYRSYTSTEGIVIGRVSTANNGLGIPNVRVSIFVPKGEYSQTDEEEVLYPFSSPTDKDGDRVRYNLLPSESDVLCYQVIGTMPTKRRILDNETVCDVFEKYYKYTTITNEAGDFMLTNIPVGKHKIHIDADLSDIGPFLSQRPYDMIENLGFDKNRFDSTRQFKSSKDLGSLAQVVSQTKSVYVYPYWGDMTEYESDMKITRTDLSLNYEFKTNAIFIGSVITDKQSNSLRENCSATETMGKMADMVTGPGRIEMIRKTVDDKIEQYRIKGDMLINDNGVWCYMIPMNLDYVRTDEFGNIIPTDDPNKGVPTRARVRFRITLNQMENDEDSHKRCSYLVPNNPQSEDNNFISTNSADYSFGSDTWDESFVDLFWNKVYTVKNYVPRLQKNKRPTNRKHTGIKMVNHFGDNNPFPYNGLTIKLSFMYRLICVLVDVFIYLVYFLNMMISIIGALPCGIASIPILWVKPFGFVMKFVPGCVGLSAEFCDDGINRNETYPGCGVPFPCIWTEKTRPDCEEQQYQNYVNGEEQAECTNDTNELFNCVENQLAQDNEATSFNFGNDWINGCLYMPLWYRYIRPKKSFFFGLFSRSAKNQWCDGENSAGVSDLMIASFCSPTASKGIASKNYKGKDVTYYTQTWGDRCEDDCHKTVHTVGLKNGVIINRDNSYGQKVWYYKSVEASPTVSSPQPQEWQSKKNGQWYVTKLLFATDIVLIGSMNDCDLNGIPKFFNKLQASTYNKPTDLLFTDTEFTYRIVDGKVANQETTKRTISTGCDWGNVNEYGYGSDNGNDSGLFYSIGCAEILVNTESCINLKRICELGINLDNSQYVEDLGSVSEGTTSWGNEDENYLRPDGFVSYDEIGDFDYRSMFATMNGNRLKTKINTESGVKEYDFRYLYIDNFDGGLQEIMTNVLSGRGDNVNYKHNYNLEQISKDYLTFRMGDNPYYYDNEHSLPKYRNSFYFYFGLKEGKTAIDLFNEQYNGKCATSSAEEESINYLATPNGWCKDDAAKGYSHSDFDGTLKLDLSNLELPCTAFLNSKSSGSVTYTIINKDGDTSINDEKLFFSGIGATPSGYKKYYLRYEDGSDVRSEMCYMINNGGYELNITDNSGNTHSYVINVNGDSLTYEISETAFKQANSTLKLLYNNSYDAVAKDNGDVSVTFINGTEEPIVSRTGKGYNINGTICVYSVVNDGSVMDKFLIEVEPYETGVDDGGKYYVDGDFWDGDDKYSTWYKIAAVVNGSTITDASVNSMTRVITTGGKSNYIVPRMNVATSYGGTVNCYVITCPKGDVKYKVTISEICGNKKSYNSIERMVTVTEPQPYKLYIGDIDYDIIRNFRTGWEPSTSSGIQTAIGSNAWQLGNVNNITGWLSISNVHGTGIYDWAVDSEKYGENKVYSDFEYKEISEGVYGYPIDAKITAKEAEEKTRTEKGEYVAWLKEYNELKNLRTILDNRLEFVEKMKDTFWITDAEYTTGSKTISYKVKTTDYPYHIWTVYNEDVEDENASKYYTESTSSTNRTGWVCRGLAGYAIEDVYNPTLSYTDSTLFGVPSDDATRRGMNTTYKEDGVCFAQDNVATTYVTDPLKGEVTANRSNVSIKPPYMVACVNAVGLSKPINMSSPKFFDKKSDNEPYQFGKVGNNQGYVSNGGTKFFAFHLLDKTMGMDVMSWSYIDNIPYYLPWLPYEPVSEEKTTAEGGNEEETEEKDMSYYLGKTITTEGILAGDVFNGRTSNRGGALVEDWATASAFGETVGVYTYIGATDDDMPTRRCIVRVNEDDEDKKDDKYPGYQIRSTDKVAITPQYVLVKNEQGTVSFTDTSTTSTSKTIYGNMHIDASSTVVTTDTTDDNITLKVYCKNSEADNANILDTEKHKMTYHLYEVSKDGGEKNWYPLNSFEYDEENDTYKLQCGDFSGDRVRWEGDTGTAAVLFKKDVNLNLEGMGHKTNSFEDGKTTCEFSVAKGSSYFVIAEDESKGYTISPVYDFTPISTYLGVVQKDSKYYIRVAIKEPAKITDKTVKNYYLTQFDFTLKCSFYELSGVEIKEIKTIEVTFDKSMEEDDSSNVDGETKERWPYFLRYVDTELDKDVYDKISPMLTNKSEYVVCSVLDVTSISHICTWTNVVDPTGKTKWDTITQNPDKTSSSTTTV